MPLEGALLGIGMSVGRRKWVVLSLGYIVAGCDVDATREVQPVQAAPTLESAVSDTSPTVPEAPPSLQVLLDALGTLEGKFVVAANGTWMFEGDRSVLIAFYDFGDAAVEALVDCLDAETPSGVLLRSAPVPLGVLCGQALHGMAYPILHEDGDGDWPGTVLPTATLEELSRAKVAWVEVLRLRTYRIV